MRDSLYYNVFSLLPSTTITCDIPHYTHQQEIYSKTTITAKITKQYSSPLTSGFFLDVDVISTSNKTTIEPGTQITIRNTNITHVDKSPIDMFAKKHKLNLDGESTDKPKDVGRPRNQVFDLDELENMLLDDDDL
jgi:hypothetical protein